MAGKNPLERALSQAEQRERSAGASGGDSKPGPRQYTFEPQAKSTHVFLRDADDQMRMDAARYRVPRKAIEIELSRLYITDPAVRRVVLEAIHRQLNRPYRHEG